MEKWEINTVKSLVYGVRHDLGLIGIGCKDIQKLEEWIEDGRISANFQTELESETLQPFTLLYEDHKELAMKAIKLTLKRLDEINSRAYEYLKRILEILESKNEE